MAKNLNYDDLRDFKTPTQKRNAAMSLMILSDMKRIDVAVSVGKFEQLKSLHIELDGTYQNQIKNWGSSMYNYVKGMGFTYEYITAKSCNNEGKAAWLVNGD